MNKSLRAYLLWISVPLCVVLAVTGLAVFWPGIYWREKPASVMGALVSDTLDLCLILPTLVVTTVLARRGSLAALLVWAGMLGYLCYNFPIYLFEVHFNAMFPAYCAVMGLSFYGLVGLREFVVPGEAAKTFSPGAPSRLMAAAFLALAFSAAAGELKEIVRAIRAGQIPAGAAEAGQLTDPIHVLDLCFLLPALVIVAVMLLRRNEMGFTLAPVLCVVLVLISIEVIAMIVVPVAKGSASDLFPVIPFAVAGALYTLLLGWYLYPKRKGAEHAAVLS